LRIEAEKGVAKWPNASFPNAAGAAIKPTGVYSPNGPATAAPWQTARLFGQGRDDVVATAGSGADDPPVNVQTSGVRAFQGRMTSLFSLALADNVSNSRAPTAGDVAKLTVVVFHNRTPADEPELKVPPELGLTVPAVFDDVTQSLSMKVTDIPSGRTFNEIIRPGVVIYDPSKTPAGEQYQRWSQVLMASVDDSPNGGAVRAFVTFASPRPNSGTVRVLLDSVGMAEQMIVVEGSSGYTR
jgi:hypothetical protein